MSLEDAFGGLIQKILEVLPTSPFRDFLDNFKNVPYLGYLNWFFPVRGVLTVMAAWLTAVSLFLLYSIIMRWVKIIGD